MSLENLIPFGVKASNLASVANFSSTLEDSYILIIANNCNTPVDNGNTYDTIYNNTNNAALFGVNVINSSTQNNQEAYIGIKQNDLSHKIAKFNSESISLDVNTIINGNLIPLIHSNYDLGSIDHQWQNIYASHTLYAGRIIGDGNGISNLRLQDYSTDVLPEGSNLYYTNDRFLTDITNTSLDQIQNGTSNRFIVDNTYDQNLSVSGLLTVDSIYIKDFSSFTQNNPDIPINITYNVTEVTADSTSVVKEGSNLYFTYDRVSSVINASNLLLSTNIVKNISNLSTSEIKEGSNLYFTAQRAGIISYASNLQVSNYITNTSNQLVNYINSIDHNTSNNISH